MNAVPPKKDSDEKISVLLADLEDKVTQLRDGDNDLETSIVLYKKCMAIAAQCEKRLEQAKMEIDRIGMSSQAPPSVDDQPDDNKPSDLSDMLP